MLQMKFDYNRPAGLRNIREWKCVRTDTQTPAPVPSYKLPRSLRLWWAKNWWKSAFQFVLKILSGNNKGPLLQMYKKYASQTQPRSCQYECKYKIWWNSVYMYLISRYWEETNFWMKYWYQSRAITLLQNLSNNPNLDLNSSNAFAKFGEILSICSEDIER